MKSSLWLFHCSRKMGICPKEKAISIKERSELILASDLLNDLFSASSQSIFRKLCSKYQRRGFRKELFLNLIDSLSGCFDTTAFALSHHRFYITELIKRDRRRLEEYDLENHIGEETEEGVLESMAILLGKISCQTCSVLTQQPLFLAESKILARLGRWQQEKNVLLRLIRLQLHNVDYSILYIRCLSKFKDASELTILIEQALLNTQMHSVYDDFSLNDQGKPLRNQRSLLLHLKGCCLYNQNACKESVLKHFKEAIETDFLSPSPYLNYLSFLTSYSFRKSSEETKLAFAHLLKVYRFQRFTECLRELPYAFYFLDMRHPSNDIIQQMQQRLARNELRGKLKENCLLGLRKVQQCMDIRRSIEYSEIILHELPQHRQEERLRFARLLFRCRQYEESRIVLLEVKPESRSALLNDEIDIKIALIDYMQNRIEIASAYYHREKARLARYFTSHFKLAAPLKEKPVRLLHSFMNFMQLIQIFQPFELIIFAENSSIVDQLPYPMALHINLMKFLSISTDQIARYWRGLDRDFADYRDYWFQLYNLMALLHRKFLSPLLKPFSNYSSEILMANSPFNYAPERDYEGLLDRSNLISPLKQIQW